MTVCGGSGFLGRQIVKRLAAEGAEVRVAVRHPGRVSSRLKAAMAGQGVALGWLGVVDQLLEANLLVVAGEVMAVQGRGYWLVPGSSSEAVNLLATWLIDEAAGSVAGRFAN